VVRDFGGVVMVLVPPGCFMLGSENGGGDEKPVNQQCFGKPFWIDRTEVTQSQFMQLGGQMAQAPYFKGNSRPVDSITWFEARDYCARRGARLPTEAEWEYAERGPDNLVYPWGNVWDEGKAVWSRSVSQGTAYVGSISNGASWVGATDMIGNVWEWTSSLYKQFARFAWRLLGQQRRAPACRRPQQEQSIGQERRRRVSLRPLELAVSDPLGSCLKGQL
jgi:formylglycine-generating enzyme required for sulfatase activity